MMAMDGEALAPQMPHIEPPEGSGWQLHSPYGAQRFKDGPDGRLVRLADVVRWLMGFRETSFANAVRAVCAPLEGDTPPLLYRLDRVDDAAPEDGDHGWFKYFPDCEDLQSLPTQLANARVAARDMKAWWLMPPHELSRLANDPSYPAEYDETKESPFEYSERTDRAGGPKNLAVSFAAAHALWGWGSAGVVDAVAPPPLSLVPTVPSPAPAGKLPQKSRAPEWTGEALARKRKELKLADPKSRNHTQQLAELTGLTPREITRREKDARDSAAPAKHAALRTSGKAA